MNDELVGVPALTLRTPWAHLVAHCGKDVENRTWLPHRGATRLMVHAGVGSDPVPDHLLPPGGLGEPAVSAIVCLVDVSDVCDLSRWSAQVVCGCGRWALPRRYHWRLRLVATLPTPVFCRGRLGLWQPDLATRSAVAAQLRLAA